MSWKRWLAWLGVLVGLYWVLMFAAALAAYWLHWRPGAFWNLHVVVMVQAAAVFLSIRIVGGRDAARTVSTFKLNPAAVGAIFAGIMIMVMAGILAGAGWLQAEMVRDLRPFTYVPVLVLVAFYEEYLFRGFLLNAMGRPCIALVISSMLFGLAHGLNPVAGWAAVIGISLCGLLIGWATLRTGSLWLAVGLHLGWDFCEGLFFGFPASGLSLPSLLHVTVTGPALVTGGRFGPEAGLILLPGLAVGAGLVWWYTRIKKPATHS